MEIIRIFQAENEGLYAVKYDGEEKDEFERIFDLWQDVEYLEDFFQKNVNDLHAFYGKNMSIEEAVETTVKYTEQLQGEILKVIRESEGGGMILLMIYLSRFIE